MAKKRPKKIEAGKPFASLLRKLAQVPKEEIGAKEEVAAKKKTRKGRPKLGM
jgi:hypothetical protein